MASTATHPATIAPHFLSLTHAPISQIPSRPEVVSKPQESHHLVASFNYYKDPGDGIPPPPAIVGKPETFEKPKETRSVPVHDIRGEEELYSLDKNGFEIYRHVSAEKEFVDEEKIKGGYYAEVEDILKKATGASKVFIFDHTIRRPANDAGDTTEKADKGQSLRGPVQQVHVDQSYKAAPIRVERHLPSEASRLLKGRYQIINVWRPIKTILKDPLGVADAKSVLDRDLLPAQLIYPDRVGETFTVKANDQHRWYYLYGQRPDEVMLIKCFDSKTDGRARRSPHSAFVDEATVNEEPRESIEVRALVFHPDDTE